jgi:hypothetical protein
MILQGHITPIWREEDYLHVTYILGTRDEMCKRLVLDHQEDHDRYTAQQFQLWYRNGNDSIDRFLGHDDFSWLDHKGISLHRTPPGHIVPSHRDQYQHYRTSLDIGQTDKIARAVVFLEDWHPGHYLGVGHRGISSWQAGDWVAWFDDTPHTIANLGSRDRYTMTVTGIFRL